MSTTPALIRAENGLLVVGHGTRDEAGLAEFHAVVAEVARRCPGIPVEPCFLELADPTIAEGLARLVLRRVRQIDVLPLLLFSAGHAKRDIPEAVAAAASQYSGLKVRQSCALESQSAILQLSTQRFEQALAGRPVVGREETLLLLVGRGSHDAEARAAFERFARLRFERLPVGRLETAFLAMAEPRLPRAVEVVAGLNFRRIVVQPHLLFRGQLLDGLREEVNRAAARWPEKDWLMTQHLGDSNFIAEAMLDGAGLVKPAGKDDLAFLERCV